MRIHLEVATETPRFAFAVDLPDAPTDLAARHDDYQTDGVRR